MPPDPATRPSLIVRLRDRRDRAAWAEFVGRYAPVVFGYARRRGLQDADAADVTQDVLSAVAAAVTHFDYAPGRGGFRAWLFEIARNRVRSFLRSTRRAARLGEVSAHAFDEFPADDGADVWEQEWRREAFAAACDAVRDAVAESTWEAFRRTALAGESPRDVADAHGSSVAAVYLARSRVLARLRAFVQAMEAEG